MVAYEEPPATAAASSRPPPAPDAVVMVIGGPIAPADVPRLCQHVRSLLEGTDAAVVVCDVGALVDPDVGTIDALARMALAARRLGRQIRLLDAPCELEQLLALVGLADVVGLTCDLRLEASRQAEQRKQPIGVEKRVELDDATALDVEDL